MTEITHFLETSYIYKVIGILLGPIWNQSLGRTAILTVFAYLIGFSFYTGYLSNFTGGFGSFSFSRLGVQLSDLITLLPASALAFVKLLPKGLRYLFLLIFLFVLPPFIGVIVGLLIRNYVAYSDWCFIIGYLVYFIALALTTYYLGKRNLKWQIVFGIFQMVGIVLLIQGVPFPLVSQPSDPSQVIATMTLPPILLWLFVLEREISVLLYMFLLFFLLPLYFGREIARVAVEERILSRVSGLVLKKPFPLLSDYQQSNTSDWNIINRILQSFRKKSTPGSDTEINTYNFSENTPLYLIETFKDTIACYLSDQDKHGKLIILDRAAVVGMTLERNTTGEVNANLAQESK